MIENSNETSENKGANVNKIKRLSKKDKILLVAREIAKPKCFKQNANKLWTANLK